MEKKKKYSLILSLPAFQPFVPRSEISWVSRGENALERKAQ